MNWPHAHARTTGNRHLKGVLGAESQGAPDVPAFRLVDMYMSCTEEVVKEEIIQSFTQNTKLRIVAATVAFGTGFTVLELGRFVHLDPPDDAESYVHETGCAGRDGAPALTLLLLKPGASRYVEHSIMEYAISSSECRRDNLFKHFDRYTHIDMGRCLCCDVCAKSCSCGMCDSKYSSFLFIGKNS